MERKYSLKNIWNYIVGWTRYYLYYSKTILKVDLSFLMRKHIKQQIKLRLSSMDRECWYSGACKKCGCDTPALQMANKACDKPCYPPLLSKYEWKKFYLQGVYYKDPKYVWYINTPKNKFNKI